MRTLKKNLGKKQIKEESYTMECLKLTCINI